MDGPPRPRRADGDLAGTPTVTRPVPSDEQTRGRRRTAGVAVAAVLLLAAAGATTVVGDRIAVSGALAAAGVATASFAVAMWGRDVYPTERTHEVRHVGAHEYEEPVGIVSRRAMLRSAAGAVVALGGAGAVVAIAGPHARRRLRGTAWKPGATLVTAEGRPVRAGQLEAGEILTVWPHGHVGDSDSQVVLIQVDGNLEAPRGRSDWAPDGQIAFSKLCTHMGCPVGLFDQERHLLVCPCHQATFDVLAGAAPVFGPAPRPLPQLPIAVGDDGVLRALGDFEEPVGPGFWERPR